MDLELRSLTIEDLSAVGAFLTAQNMAAGQVAIKYLLEHNPGLSQGVFAGTELKGMVLCSFDGLRGYLNKLVVAEDVRSFGWGQRLIGAAADQLRLQNCPELMINCHPYLAKWYEKQGFVRQDTAHYVLQLTGKETDEACG